MSSYVKTARKGLKWYTKLWIDILLGLSVVIEGSKIQVYQKHTHSNISNSKNQKQKG